MSSSFPARSLAFVAAVAGAGAEVSLTAAAGLEAYVALPLAIVTGGAVIWSGLALDALVRRRSRPDRGDLQCLVEMLRADRGVADERAERLASMEEVVAFLRADPALAEAEHTLAEAARAVERWDSLHATFPRWIAARDHWAAIATNLAPDAVEDLDRVDDDEARAARDRLPITQNFSSHELKTATAYLVQTERWMAARAQLLARRRTVLDAGFRQPTW